MWYKNSECPVGPINQSVEMLPQSQPPLKFPLHLAPNVPPPLHLQLPAQPNPNLNNRLIQYLEIFENLGCGSTSFTCNELQLRSIWTIFLEDST